MGCTSSTDGAQPNGKNGNKSLSKGQENWKDMTELDDVRVKFILDYWYDDGKITNSAAIDGEGETIHDFHQRMLQMKENAIKNQSSPKQSGHRKNQVIDISKAEISSSQVSGVMKSEPQIKSSQTAATSNTTEGKNETGSKEQSQTIESDPNSQNIKKMQSPEEDKVGEGENEILDEENAGIDKSDMKWDRNSKLPPHMMKRWFGGGPHTDAEITMLFKDDLIDIGQGTVAHWQGDKMGKLATIILSDQLSRNIYRGRAEAFSFDHISLKLSKQIINENRTLFKSYALFEKLFIVLPLMHSEHIEDCQMCAEVLQHMIDYLQKEGQYELVRIIEMNKRWCEEHLEILELFGRYPHRNKVLGRESNEEEDQYLRDASCFGRQGNSGYK